MVSKRVFITDSHPSLPPEGAAIAGANLGFPPRGASFAGTILRFPPEGASLAGTILRFPLEGASLAGTHALVLHSLLQYDSHHRLQILHQLADGDDALLHGLNAVVGDVDHVGKALLVEHVGESHVFGLVGECQ